MILIIVVVLIAVTSNHYIPVSQMYSISHSFNINYSSESELKIINLISFTLVLSECFATGSSSQMTVLKYNHPKSINLKM